MDATAVDAVSVTEEEVAQRLASSPRARPRVLISPVKVTDFRRRVATEPAMAAAAGEIERRARRLLDAPPLERQLQGRRLLAVSREALNRQLLLGVAWLRTGDAVFSERAAAELRTVCTFEDWNPTHFLDVAEMSLAVAIGYDWFYEALPADVRQLSRTALVTKGLAPSLVGRPGWVDAHNNWGQVCHAGMVAAALAVVDDEPALAARIVHRAITCIPASMAAYAPDGVYPEGPMYWAYGTSFNVVLLDCLANLLGTDYGLSRQPGFLASADYMLHATGPSGVVFNYADCVSETRNSATLLWFAARKGWLLPGEAPEGALVRGDGWRLSKDRLAALAVFDMPAAGDGASVRLPLDWHGRGDVPVAMHRSDWSRDAWYVGVKAGSPSANHGHMDGGSFVLAPDGRSATLRQNGKAIGLCVAGLPTTASGSRIEVVVVDHLLQEFDSPAPGFRLVRFSATAPADGRLAWQVTFGDTTGAPTATEPAR